MGPRTSLPSTRTEDEQLLKDPTYQFKRESSTTRHGRVRFPLSLSRRALTALTRHDR